MDDTDPALTPAQMFDAARELRAQASQFVKDENPAGAAEALSKTLAYQPCHGSNLANLAILQAETGDLDAAKASFEALDVCGLAYPAATLAGAVPEEHRDSLMPLLLAIEENGAPTGSAETLAEIAMPETLIESVTSLDGIFHVSGIAAPGIYRIETGKPAVNLLAGMSDFGSVFEIEAADGLLWAATAVVPQTGTAHQQALSALIAVDPDSGAVRYRFQSPFEEAMITDFARAGDRVYFTDQENGAILGASLSSGEITTIVPAETFGSLQGITFDGTSLFAADYATGLYRISPDTGALTWLTSPGLSLIGVDGLSTDGRGGLIAVRNGAQPTGVLHIALTVDGSAIKSVTPLATGLEEFNDPTLGFIEDGRFIFIGNSQWPLFPEDGPPDPAELSPVRIMATPLP